MARLVSVSLLLCIVVALFGVVLPSSLSSFAASQTVYLTVAYCPTFFTGEGAVVAVDVSSGDFSIVGTFKWPNAVYGCTVDYDPIVTFDAASGTVYLYFDEVQVMTAVSIKSATVVDTKPSESLFWTGFENMLYQASSNTLIGVSGDVTENGYCNDGCFQYGSFDVSNGKYTKYQDIPFKAAMDDTHYYDPVNQIFYIQASYDLRPSGERCAPNDDDECLLAIDGTNGKLLTANYTTWVAYAYTNVTGPDGVSKLAWINGFDSLCKHPYDDFLFGWVNLQNASATPIACIPHNVVVDMDEWIASFTEDGSLFATGSGDAETGIPQLLVFDTTTAAVVLNSTLSGLGQQLGSKDNLFDIWSVDFF